MEVNEQNYILQQTLQLIAVFAAQQHEQNNWSTSPTVTFSDTFHILVVGCKLQMLQDKDMPSRGARDTSPVLKVLGMFHLG